MGEINFEGVDVVLLEGFYTSSVSKFSKEKLTLRYFIFFSMNSSFAYLYYKLNDFSNNEFKEFKYILRLSIICCLS